MPQGVRVIETFDKFFHFIQTAEIHNHITVVEFVRGDKNFDDIGMSVNIFPAPLRGTITDNMRPFEFELFSNQHTKGSISFASAKALALNKQLSQTPHGCSPPR